MNEAVAAKEDNFENINIDCRPMTVSDDYQNLMSNAWLDAKEALDDCEDCDMREQEKTKFLCRVLEVFTSTSYGPTCIYSLFAYLNLSIFENYQVSEQTAKAHNSSIQHELRELLFEPLSSFQKEDNNTAAAQQVCTYKLYVHMYMANVIQLYAFALTE